MEVSYIVTVYNKEKYLKDVIRGIREQRGNFQSEIVFIDDGSTDGSLHIIKEETQGIDNIRIISQVNQGLIRATIRGIDEARGKYLIFCDGDDVLLPDATQLLMEGVKSANTKLATCCLFIPKNEHLIDELLIQKDTYCKRKLVCSATVHSHEISYNYIVENLPDFQEHKIEGYFLQDAFQYALYKDAYFIGATGSLMENSIAKRLAKLEPKALHTQDVLFTMNAIFGGHLILCINAIGSYPLTFINEQFRKEKLSANVLRVCNDLIGTYLKLVEAYSSELDKPNGYLSDIVAICLKRWWYREKHKGVNRLSLMYFLYKIRFASVKLFGIGSQRALSILESIFSEG